MVYGCEHNGCISFQPVHVTGDAPVVLVAIGCLDNVVNMTHKLCREDTDEVAYVAEGLHLIESHKRTNDGIGRPEVLPLNKGVQVPSVPPLTGPHRPDAEDREQHRHHTEHYAPEPVPRGYGHDGKQQRKESHPPIIGRETACYGHDEDHIERT